jgi:hypothetical protein
MVEHEIHHRGQVYIYLSLLGVATPPLYGLTSEQVPAAPLWIDFHGAALDLKVVSFEHPNLTRYLIEGIALK